MSFPANVFVTALALALVVTVVHLFGYAISMFALVLYELIKAIGAKAERPEIDVWGQAFDRAFLYFPIPGFHVASTLVGCVALAIVADGLGVVK